MVDRDYRRRAETRSPARGRAFPVLREFRLLGSILFKLRRQGSALAWDPRHLA